MPVGTRDALLNAAEHMMRSKGYAAFSYADLVDEVGIRKASIHHHFPTKEDLGVAIVEGYIDRVKSEFERIEQESDKLIDRLSGFTRGFQDGLLVGRLPLCGALAAEMAVLPGRLQTLTYEFFDMQLQWLTKILDHAISRKQIPAKTDTEMKAYQILSLMEGSSFVSWAMRDRGPIDASALLNVIKAR
ncbi:TetR family transcriptional regulator [Paraburkholderia sp. BL6669N2]|uniref:TetR/AcrR family transcriptional regulator n=1 Tax=Paraburkholderia sp. BL6669N2 TaxID=1938807 RepID=UPI000E27E0E1|nr:TetR/AcrR family transcriptional regulator [Paraburkholderia sp. BL6669N2]REG45505.1 TetR family transcriptional regulator [Paraburkholderia sp. BL6669N2]